MKKTLKTIKDIKNLHNPYLDQVRREGGRFWKIGMASMIGLGVFNAGTDIYASTKIPFKKTEFELGERVVLVPDSFVDMEKAVGDVSITSDLTNNDQFNYSEITKEITSVDNTVLQEGEYTITFEADGVKRHAKINVIDTQAPEIRLIDKKIRVAEDTPLKDIQKYIQISDFSEFSYQILQDPVNPYTAKPGHFNIHILAQDKHLNTTTAVLNVEVVSKEDVKAGASLTYTTEEKTQNDKKDLADGWYEDMYYQNGLPLYGAQYIDGFWYLFDDFGHLQTGWVETKQGKTYYGQDGKQIFGQYQTKDTLYVFDDKTGILLEETPVKKFEETKKEEEKKVEEKIEEIQEDEDKLFGLQTIEVNGKEETYYFNSKGEKETGFINHNGATYYFDKNAQGAMVKGLVEIQNDDGKHLAYFNEEGRQQFGLQSVVKETKDEVYNYMYYFDKENKGYASTGIVTLPDTNETVFFNEEGVMSFGFIEYKGSTYYFDKFNNGQMQKGFMPLNDFTYYFNEEGKMAIGPTKVVENGGEKLLFFNELGQQTTGYVEWKGKWYLFDETTKEAKTGWQKVPAEMNNGVEKTVFFNTDGTMKTGHHQEGDAWMYLSKTGEKTVGATQVKSRTSGNTITVGYDKDGKQLFGKQTIDGKTYIFEGKDGHAVQGFYTDDGVLKYMELGVGFVKGTKNLDGYQITADDSGRIVRTEHTNFTYFSQKDPRWGSLGAYSFASTGCVPSSIAMAIVNLTGRDVTPYSIGIDLHYRGYYNAGIRGTTLGAIPYIANKYGIPIQSRVNEATIRNELLRGKVLLTIVRPGSSPWTIRENHEMLAHSYDARTNQVYVEDPYGQSGWFDLSYLLGCTLHITDNNGGGPLYILG